MNGVVRSQGRAPTGIEGLDVVLGGGLPRSRVTLVRGETGTGKTTMGLQFLRAGAAAGERTLYCSLLQSMHEVVDVATSHGWDLDGVEVLELPDHVRAEASAEQTVFPTSDIELNEATDALAEAIRRIEPDRLVLDSVTELSLLVESPYQLRRQVLKIKREMNEIGCTSLFTSSEAGDSESVMQTIVTGSIRLKHGRVRYGPPRRRLEVEKVRGAAFERGWVDYRLATGGVRVFPRLSAVTGGGSPAMATIQSGVEPLDRLLGGGLETGTSCLISGGTGAGKSTLAGLYVHAVAARGERCQVHCFDERRATFTRRMAGLGMDVSGDIDRGLVELRAYDVGGATPGELFASIRDSVERDGTKLVVIDSLDGFTKSFADGDPNVTQLHDLLGFLHSRDVLTILTAAMTSPFGESRTNVEASYLADTIVLVRHFEGFGRIRRCVSVLKKRHGSHETAIREFRTGPDGVHVGEPLDSFTGLMTGRLVYAGRGGRLMDAGEPDAGDGDGGD